MGHAGSLRLGIARKLEEGTWQGPIAEALSHAWGALATRSLARPLRWRDGLCTVAVGGATLGGSGKTPLAIACADAVADGARVAYVAHGYRARPGAPRVVQVDDDVAVVGDEALVAARALAGRGVVVVGPSRQAALDFASDRADIAVLDGVLQTTPRRATLSLLALDAGHPWGAGRLPPRGDLRAPHEALLASCDRPVRVQYRSRGVHASGRLFPWRDLVHLRIGLFLALARPARVLELLATHDIVPCHVVRVPDHGLPPAAVSSRFPGAQVDLWVASAKCATHLEAAGIPHASIDQAVVLDGALKQALRLAYTQPEHRLRAP